MRKYLMAGAAALSMAVLPQAVFAQAEVPEETDAVDAAAAPTSDVPAAPASDAAATSSPGMASSAAGASNVTIRYESNEMVQGGLTATPQDEYPVCKGDVQDGCINPRAAGENWGNRPLDHWPGKPASEM